MKVAWIEDVELEELQKLDGEGNPMFEDDGVTPIMEQVEVGVGTGVVTGINRGAVDGEQELNEPTTAFTKGYVPDYYEITFGKVFSVKSEDDIGALKLVNRKVSMQASAKSTCENLILTKYPLPIQSSMSLGVYPDAEVRACKGFIADCIEEENRIFGLVEAASDELDLQLIAPNWPEAE